MEKFTDFPLADIASRFGYVPIGMPALVLGSELDDALIEGYIVTTHAPTLVEYDAVAIYKKRIDESAKFCLQVIPSEELKNLPVPNPAQWITGVLSPENVARLKGLEFHIIQPLVKKGRL